MMRQMRQIWGIFFALCLLFVQGLAAEAAARRAPFLPPGTAICAASPDARHAPTPVDAADCLTCQAICQNLSAVETEPFLAPTAPPVFPLRMQRAPSPRLIAPRPPTADHEARAPPVFS